MNTDVTSVALSDLTPWEGQPRGRGQKDTQQDADLLASVAARGVLQSLVVRPKKGATGYLIVCGERRFHAAVAAGIKRVPASIRDLTDAEALAIGLEENIQRKNMHPLEESAALVRLQGLDKALRTPAALAAAVGSTERHVRDRLKFARLGSVARAAFMADALTAQQAETLARIPDEKVQVEAMTHGCYMQLYRNELGVAIKSGDFGPLKANIAPFHELREWVRRNTVADLKDEAVQAEFPEVQALLQQHEKAGTAIVRLSDGSHKVPAGILDSSKWREVKGKRCAHTVEGVVVHGGALGIRKVCLTQTCAQHWPELQRTKTDTAAGLNHGAGDRKWQQQEAQRRSKENAWVRLRKNAWPSVVAAVKRKATVNAKLVTDVLSDYAVREVTNRTGITFSDDTAAAVLALHGILRKSNNRQAFGSAVKKYGFDLAKFEREQKATKAAAAKAKTKARTGSGQKARNVKGKK